jgi:hypothetical protein
MSDGGERQTAALLVGRSGSGKSRLASSLLSTVKKPVFSINDRSFNKRYTPTSWDKLSSLKNCAVLIEDILFATKPEFRLLQELLNVSNHHRRVSPIYLVCHSVEHTNVRGLLSFLNKIYLTASKSNAYSLRKILQYLVFEKSEVEEFSKKFLSAASRPYDHFVIDADDRTFGRLDETRANAGRMCAAQDMAGRLLGLMEEPGKCSAIYDMVRAKLPKSSFSEDEMTVTLKNKKKNDSVVINLVDYVHSLTNPDVEPSSELRLFHKYVCKTLKVRLPQCLVKNKNY